MADAFIFDHVRTPRGRGKPDGALHGITPVQLAAQALQALGVSRVDLLTNNPDKAGQLRRLGVDVVATTPTEVHLTAANARYLQAKVERTGHTLALPLAG